MVFTPPQSHDEASAPAVESRRSSSVRVVLAVAAAAACAAVVLVAGTPVLGPALSSKRLISERIHLFGAEKDNERAWQPPIPAAFTPPPPPDQRPGMSPSYASIHMPDAVQAINVGEFGPQPPNLRAPPPPRPVFSQEHLKQPRWDFCALEGDLCACDGRVRFGLGLLWKTYDKEMSGTTNCDVALFGEPGNIGKKTCECLPKGSWMGPLPRHTNLKMMLVGGSIKRVDDGMTGTNFRNAGPANRSYPFDTAYDTKHGDYQHPVRECDKEDQLPQGCCWGAGQVITRGQGHLSSCCEGEYIKPFIGLWHCPGSAFAVPTGAKQRHGESRQLNRTAPAAPTPPSIGSATAVPISPSHSFKSKDAGSGLD